VLGLCLGAEDGQGLWRRWRDRIDSFLGIIFFVTSLLYAVEDLPGGLGYGTGIEVTILS